MSEIRRPYLICMLEGTGTSLHVFNFEYSVFLMVICRTKHSSKHVCYSSSSTDESSTESEVQSNESTGSSDESLSAGRLEKSSRKRKHSKKEHSHHSKTKRKKISKNLKVKHKHKQKRRSKHREKHKHKHKIKTSTTSPDHTEVASIGMYGPSIGPALPSTSKTIASASESVLWFKQVTT